MSKRKGMLDILDCIYRAIPVNKVLPISTIAYNAGVSIETAKRYMDMIRMIQGWPFIHEEQIGELKGYRRQTKAGRPRK